MFKGGVGCHVRGQGCFLEEGHGCVLGAGVVFRIKSGIIHGIGMLPVERKQTEQRSEGDPVLRASCQYREGGQAGCRRGQWAPSGPEGWLWFSRP